MCNYQIMLWKNTKFQVIKREREKSQLAASASWYMIIFLHVTITEYISSSGLFPVTPILHGRKKIKLLPLTALSPPPKSAKLSYLQCLLNIYREEKGEQHSTLQWTFLTQLPWQFIYFIKIDIYTHTPTPQIQKIFKVHLTAYCQIAR